MTATGRVRASSKNPGFWERTLMGVRTYFGPDDIITLPILIILLLMPALALEAADWPLSQGVLAPVITLSTAMGLILARSRFNELLALIVGATYGVCLVLVLTAIVEVGSITTGAYTVFVRAVQWGVDAVTGGVNPDDLVLTLLVSVLFWFLGYNAAWHAFRIDRVWRVILPPGLILLTNTAFYPGDRDLTWYLVGFTFAAMLLVVRSNLDAREWEWYTAGVRAPRYLRHQFMLVGAVLSMLTMVVAWGAPSGNLDERLESFKEFLQSEPLERLTEFWNRLFSSVEAHGPTTADYYGGDRLDLGGAIRLGDQTVFLVNTTPGRRYYWRSRVFDTYEGGSWTSAADTRLTDNRAPFDIIYEETRSRVLVEQEFTMALGGSRLVYTAPQPVRVDVSTRTDLRYVPNAEDPNRTMNLSVIRPTQVIRRGDTYTASSLVSTASAFELRVAGTDYPQWVRDLYLYVSPTVTDRTVQLARQIVTETGATNPYDQAKAVESWLRANITYNETIPRPPSGQDPVDWVLFDFNQGYCNYYASAMIVMLRSLGIPARMAAGFAQGTYDPAEGVYVVTERDAHTWVEAYFPGYGWIEFEPTAAQAPLEREGDGEFTEQIAPPPQVATPTPTPTPSPEPSPTPTPSTPTPQTPTPEQNNPPQATATVTPTFTPTPTATAIIVPTQPAPIEPESRGPLEFILPALGLALLGLLVLVVLAALGTFIWWWWEWRGMKGLSPISRAYARLERYLGLIGMRFNTQQTPEERRRVIVKGIPKAERPVTTITRMYTTERYGPRSRHPADSQRTTRAADEAWSSARGNILSRWLRRFVPWLRNRD